MYYMSKKSWPILVPNNYFLEFYNGSSYSVISEKISNVVFARMQILQLSDFTLRGQRSATLAVPTGEDFIFQVSFGYISRLKSPPPLSHRLELYPPKNTL